MLLLLLNSSCLLTTCSPAAEAAAADQPSHAAVPQRKPQAHTTAQTYQVAVVNDVPGHFEVLAGVVEVLRQLHIKPAVLYTGSSSTPSKWGLWAWLGGAAKASGSAASKGGSGPSRSRSVDAASTVRGGLTRAGREEGIYALETAGQALATWHTFHSVEGPPPPQFHASLLICISPELAPAVCK